MCIYLSNTFSSESTICHILQIEKSEKYNIHIIAIISIHVTYIIYKH